MGSDGGTRRKNGAASCRSANKMQTTPLRIIKIQPARDASADDAWRLSPTWWSDASTSPPGRAKPPSVRDDATGADCLAELPHQHLQAVAQLLVDAQGGGRLVAAMHHAILAARVLAVAVFLPGRVVHQPVEGLMMLV